MFEIFDQILALANKLMYSVNTDSKRKVVLVIGEMGNGKSSTMNELIEELNKMFDREVDEEEQEYFNADAA
jgi:Tfp pilus assembly pilus retraction ATPase PilT